VKYYILIQAWGDMVETNFVEAGNDQVLARAVKMVVVAETVAVLLLVLLVFGVKADQVEKLSAVTHMRFKIVMER